MTATIYTNQFNRIESSLNQMQYPFKGMKDFICAACRSIMLNVMTFFVVRSIQKKMENRGGSTEEFKEYLQLVRKSRNSLYDLDQKLEMKNFTGVTHYNVHSSLSRLDDLTENLEMYVDEEFQNLGQKIAGSH